MVVTCKIKRAHQCIFKGCFINFNTSTAKPRFHVVVFIDLDGGFFRTVSDLAFALNFNASTVEAAIIQGLCDLWARQR